MLTTKLYLFYSYFTSKFVNYLYQLSVNEQQFAEYFYSAIFGIQIRYYILSNNPTMNNLIRWIHMYLFV